MLVAGNTAQGGDTCLHTKEEIHVYLPVFNIMCLCKFNRISDLSQTQHYSEVIALVLWWIDTTTSHE